MLDGHALSLLGEVYVRSPLAMFVWRAAGDRLVLAGMNTAALEGPFRPAADLLGEDSETVFGGGSAPVIHTDLRRCHQEQRPLTRDVEYVFRDGVERRHIHLTYTPIASDLVLACAQDITELWDRANEHEDRARELEQLTEMTGALLEAEDGATARAVFCRAALEMAGADHVYLVEPQDGDLVQTAVARTPGSAPVDLPRVALHTGEVSLAATVFHSHERLFVPDVSLDPRANRHVMAGSLSWSAFFEPVLARSAIIGVLVVGWGFPMPATPKRAERLMPLLARHAGLVIAQADLLERLHREAALDELTELPNRRAADAELERQLSHARRTRQPLSVCVLDINGMKKVNDAEGHDAGDALLVEAAAAWRAALRTEDQIARVGGDEFVIVMPGTDAAAGRTALDRLRAAAPHISAAMGLAEWDHQQTAAQLLAAADSAMYSDKRRMRHAPE